MDGSTRINSGHDLLNPTRNENLNLLLDYAKGKHKNVSDKLDVSNNLNIIFFKEIILDENLPSKLQ